MELIFIAIDKHILVFWPFRMYSAALASPKWPDGVQYLIMRVVASMGGDLQYLNKCRKISHMQRVLTIVGQRKIKEHSCTFCKVVVGNNATGEIGFLDEC